MTLIEAASKSAVLVIMTTLKNGTPTSTLLSNASASPKSQKTPTKTL